MVIAGAGGHARELMGILGKLFPNDSHCFYDDITTDGPTSIWNKYPVIRSAEQLKAIFGKDPRYIIGVGAPAARRTFWEKMNHLGGEPFSIIAASATIGENNVVLGKGLNVLYNAVITQDIRIGNGCLIHVNVTIHHDCSIGDFCEISPGAHLLGKASIGNDVSVGSAAVVLPGITIGDGAVIGAGAVVTKNIERQARVKGIPAK